MSQQTTLRALDAALHAGFARAGLAEDGTYTPPTPPGGAAVACRVMRTDVTVEEFGDGRAVASTRVELAILRADTLAAAAQRAAKGEVRGGTVLGVAFEERALRQAAEQAYRFSASLCGEPELRSHLIEEAHQLRPWSLF